MKPGPPISPLDKVAGLADKAKTLIPNKPGVLSPQKNAALRRAQETLTRLGESRVAKTPVGEALRGYIQSQIAIGEGLEDLQEEVFARAKAEVEQRKHLVAGLQRIGKRYFTGSDKLRRLSFEVLQPAKRRQLSSNTAWQRVDNIALGRPTESAAQGSVRAESTTQAATHTQTAEEEERQQKKKLWVPTPIQDTRATMALLQDIEAEFGPVYFAVNVKAEAGLALGAGVSYGIGGMRHGKTFVQTTHSISVGTAEAQAAGELEVMRTVWGNAEPKNEAKVTFEVAGGGGFALAGEVTVSLVPTVSNLAKHGAKAILPTKQEEIGFWTNHKETVVGYHERAKKAHGSGPLGIFDYEFDGVKLAFGMGAGVDLSMSIAFGTCEVLGDKDWPN